MALRLNNDVKRVVLVKAGSGGARRPVQVYSADDDDDDNEPIKFSTLRTAGGADEPRRKRKKQSKLLRPLEKAMRLRMKKRSAFARHYLALHERSNAKKKNGWLRDLRPNLMKALRRGYF